MTLPLSFQKRFVEDVKKEGREMQTYELNTGHCPNFTAPQEVADLVAKIAV
jgi:DNA-binding sugar fermentation-stimulating protein